jgi:hypothetical protein
MIPERVDFTMHLHVSVPLYLISETLMQIHQISYQ